MKSRSKDPIQAAMVDRIRAKFGTVANFARLHGIKINEMRKMIRCQSPELLGMVSHAEAKVQPMSKRKLRGYVVMLYGSYPEMAKAEGVSIRAVNEMIAGKHNIAWVKLLKRIKEGAAR